MVARRSPLRWFVRMSCFNAIRVLLLYDKCIKLFFVRYDIILCVPSFWRAIMWPNLSVKRHFGMAEVVYEPIRARFGIFYLANITTSHCIFITSEPYKFQNFLLIYLVNFHVTQSPSVSTNPRRIFLFKFTFESLGAVQIMVSYQNDEQLVRSAYLHHHPCAFSNRLHLFW